MMNCEQAKPLIQAYADGELEAAAILELESHLQTCPACAAELRAIQNLKKTLKQEAVYFAAPAELRRRIMAELPSPAPATPTRQPSGWNWLTTLFSGLATACLALLLVVTLGRSPSGQPLAQEIVSSHIRSLMASHVIDVASSDQHTVKPWFNGKLDFSPPVKDLAAQDFPLIGGRLDYLGEREVAALVFQRHKHFINLFIWPANGKDSKPAAIPARQGYHLVQWTGSGMTFWAVSDLNEKELMEFAQSYVTIAPN